MTWLRTFIPRLVFAVFLSFSLWVYVSYNENPDRATSFESVPVYVRDIPPGLVIVDQNGLPRSDQTMLSDVTLNLRTDQDTLSELRQNDLRAFVDLGSLIPGDHIVKVDVETTVANLSINNFSFVSADPEFLSVRLEQWETRTVPLTIEVRGNLPFSFERGDPDVRFKGQELYQVQVEGPQGRLERVASAQAVANIDQLRASYISSLQLQAFDANNDPVDGVTIEPAKVDVRVPIQSVVGLKRVPVLGKIDGLPAPGYVIASIRSEPPLVNISGSSERLDQINQIETTPININGATGVVTQNVGMLFPSGVSRSSSEDTQVVVTVQIIPILRPFQVHLPFSVQITNATPGLIVSYTPTVVQVPISGFASSLSTFDPSVVVAQVNAQGLLPGTYVLTSHIALPEGLVVDGDTPAVHVTLDMPPTPTPALSPTSEMEATPGFDTTPTGELSETTSSPTTIPGETQPFSDDSSLLSPPTATTDNPFAEVSPIVPFGEDATPTPTSTLFNEGDIPPSPTEPAETTPSPTFTFIRATPTALPDEPATTPQPTVLPDETMRPSFPGAQAVPLIPPAQKTR